MKDNNFIVVLSDFETYDLAENTFILRLSDETFEDLQSGKISVADLDTLNHVAIPYIQRVTAVLPTP